MPWTRSDCSALSFTCDKSRQSYLSNDMQLLLAAEDTERFLLASLKAHQTV